LDTYGNYPNTRQAIVDQDKCNGCQDCVDRRQFDAIEMIRAKTPTTKKREKGKLIPSL